MEWNTMAGALVYLFSCAGLGASVGVIMAKAMVAIDSRCTANANLRETVAQNTADIAHLRESLVKMGARK